MSLTYFGLSRCQYSDKVGLTCQPASVYNPITDEVQSRVLRTLVGRVVVLRTKADLR